MATHTRSQKTSAQVAQPVTDPVQEDISGTPPMRTYDAGRGMHLTAQYLYDQLVGNSQADTTRMTLVKQAVDTIDTANFKKMLADMVEIAKKLPDEKVRAAKHKTAKNVQSVMRAAYGALKFAPTQLKETGYSPATTGYHDMAVFAKTALEKADIKWDGTKKVAPPSDLDKKQVEADLVMAELKKKNPRLKLEDGTDFAETTLEYNERILYMLDDAIEQHAIDTLAVRVETACRDIIKAHREMVPDIRGQLMIVMDKVLAEEEAAEVSKAKKEAVASQQALH